MLLRQLKRSYGIFVVFFAISFFVSISISCILSSMKIIINSNEYLSDKFKAIQISNRSDISNIKFMDIIESEPDIIFYENFMLQSNNNSTIRGCGVYFNNDIFKKPPLVEGRFFNSKDFNENNPTAVIGKNLLGSIQVVNNDRYFTYNDIKYKIIGIMGYKNIDSHYDNEFIINLKSFIYNDKNFDMDLKTFFWKIDGFNEKNMQILDNIYNKFKVIDPDFQIEIINIANSSTYNPLIMAANNTKTITSIIILLVLCLFFNVINITYIWVYKVKKEIGVRIAFGANNKRIIFRTIFNYQVIAIMASILALLVKALIEKYSNVLNLIYDTNINKHLYFESSIVLLFFALILGLITAIIPIRKILKMNANDIIRGK